MLTPSSGLKNELREWQTVLPYFCLLALIFSTEDGCSTFLPDFSKYYMTSQLRRYSSTFCFIKKCCNFFTAFICKRGEIITMPVFVSGSHYWYGFEICDCCMVMFLLWTQYCVFVTFKFALSVSGLQFLWLDICSICFSCLRNFLYLAM
jgi:hypothetical protein